MGRPRQMRTMRQQTACQGSRQSWKLKQRCQVCSDAQVMLWKDGRPKRQLKPRKVCRNHIFTELQKPKMLCQGYQLKGWPKKQRNMLTEQPKMLRQAQGQLKQRHVLAESRRMLCQAKDGQQEQPLKQRHRVFARHRLPKMWPQAGRQERQLKRRHSVFADHRLPKMQQQAGQQERQLKQRL
ncbi:unnamed protein product [Effrenium voratum]|nr:unnamed protein product [Effrenium voratum]